MSRKSNTQSSLKESASTGFKLPFLDKLHENSRSSSAVDLRIKKDGFDGLHGGGGGGSGSGTRSASPSGPKPSSKGVKKYSSSSNDLDKKNEFETVGTVSGYGDYLGEELSKMNINTRIPLSRPKTTENVISRLPEDGAGLEK